MRPSRINHKLKILQRAAKLKQDAERGGHSFQAGGALDLMETGESLENIMLRVDWIQESMRCGT